MNSAARSAAENAGATRRRGFLPAGLRTGSPLWTVVLLHGGSSRSAGSAPRPDGWCLARRYHDGVQVKQMPPHDVSAAHESACHRHATPPTPSTGRLAGIDLGRSGRVRHVRRAPRSGGHLRPGRTDRARPRPATRSGGVAGLRTEPGSAALRQPLPADRPPAPNASPRARCDAHHVRKETPSTRER
jgi:hypothetical protein